MRRRTLVNLDLRDEDDRSVSLPGLRLTQQLDGSVLLAAAAAERIPNLERGSPMRKFIQEVIAGTHEQVFKAVQAFERKASQQSTDREYAAQCAMVHRLKSNFTQYLARPVRRFIQETIARKYEQALEEKDTKQLAHLEKAAQKPLFGAMVHRLKSNFTLYVFLPVKSGRHRLLRMSFDEPTEWKPRPADLTGSKDTGYVYTPDMPIRCRDLTRAKSAIGWKPTRIRFKVPSAENAASYHFEITAPPGLRIVEANLLAGRPNEPNRHVSTDYVVGHSPTTGLHAVEVPHGSLCEAQVDVRVPTHGWLSTTLVTCWMILIVLVSVVWHIREPAGWSTEQVTNIIALLIAAAAGGAALIAQREFGGIAARLVTHMRVLGVVALALPIVVAGFLAYQPRGRQGSSEEAPALDGIDQFAAVLAASLAAAIAVTITFSWYKARDKRRSGIPSPWDMTRDIKRPTYVDFDAAREALGFDSPAVGVRSAEGWHERYEWTDGKLSDAIDALENLKNSGGGSDHGVTCHALQTTCMSSGRCPSALLDGAAGAGADRSQ